MPMHEVAAQAMGRVSLVFAGALLVTGALLQACDVALQWWAGSLALTVGKE